MTWLQYIWHSMTLSLTRKGLLAAIFLATALLTIGYLSGQLWVETPVVFLVGVLWIVCVLRELRWAASPLFILTIGAAAVGYLARLPHILMLAAGCTGVVAWDLHHFEARLLDIGDQTTREIEKSHLQRSLIVIAACFLVITLDSWLQVRFQFIVLVVVTVLAILILNQLILAVRKSGKPTPPPE